MMQVMGAVFVLLLWQIASMFNSEIIIASPYDSFREAFAMLTDRSFVVDHLSVTTVRVLVSLLLGSFLGFCLGIVAGRFSPVRSFMEPMRRVLNTLPGVVAAVLSMLWFGLGSPMVIFLNTVFVVPVVYLNVVESISKCDTTYIEMAQVFDLDIVTRIKDIYVPVISSALTASLVVVTGNSMRLVVLGEVLGAGEGLGYVVSISRARLDMPVLYGCVIICFAFVWSGEIIIRKLLLRWCRV